MLTNKSIRFAIAAAVFILIATVEAAPTETSGMSFFSYVECTDVLVCGMALKILLTTILFRIERQACVPCGGPPAAFCKLNCSPGWWCDFNNCTCRWYCRKGPIP